MYSSHREPVKNLWRLSVKCEEGRGSNCILEHNQFSKTSLICHLDIKMIVRIGQVLISFPNVTLEREGVDEGAGQNAMFSVFVSLSPFVFDTQSGRSLAHLKTHLGRVTSKYFPSAAESNSRKISLWQAGCCVAYG